MISLDLPEGFEVQVRRIDSDALKRPVQIVNDSQDPDDWPVDEEATRAFYERIGREKLERIDVSIMDARGIPKRLAIRSPLFSTLSEQDISAAEAEVVACVDKAVAAQLARQV